MAKKMLIDATHPEETRVVVADGNKVEEFDFESLNKRQLAGNIYLAKVTRVEPSLQAAFVDYGGNRHGFLAFSEIHPDYYQIPVADREALLAEERAYAEEQAKAEDEAPKPKRRRSRRRKSAEVKAEEATKDAVATGEATAPSGMDVVDLGDTPEAEGPVEIAVDEATPEAETTDPDPETEAQAETAEAPEADSASNDAAPEVTETASDGEAAAETLEADAPDSAEDAEAAAEDTADEAAAPAEDVDSEAEEADGEAEADSDDEAEGDTAPKAETVADDDTEEEIRPARKPRARRYKIQEVVKVRQIMLVQVVKEERGNKGAALTTYLSLAGRYCVLMPNTARGGGISRKITNAADRKKLKEIATSLDVPQGAGLIVRTAGAKRTKTEIKRDYEYLQRQWEQVRALTLESTAPAPIYEEGNLIHRSIRDLYNRDIGEVLVEGDAGYRQAKDFMKMIMPSHAKNVKHYADQMPLFAKHKVESYLADMFNPTVQLKSGGYIVIGITEALVAIDVNSGKATKEGSIEETALKTNLEAAEEVARQVRLRDLAGLIVIDFIDMDDRRNNSAVEKRIKEKLKSDRARIQVGRISAFGLMEMSRQRLRPGMLEATTQPCPHCHGTGLIRSDDNLALSILRQLEEEGTKRRAREVLLTAPVGIINFLMNEKRDYLAAIEARYGLSIRIEADPAMIPPDYKIEKFNTATRRVPTPAPVVSMDAALMDEIEEEANQEEEAEAQARAEGDEGDAPKKKRRRRRGGRGRRKNGANGEASETEANPEAQAEAEASPEADAAEPAPEIKAAEAATTESEEAAPAEAVDTPAEEEAPKPKRRSRRKPKAKAEAEVTEAAEDSTAKDPAPEAETAEAEAPEAAPAEEIAPEPAPEPEPEAPSEPEPAPEPEPVLETSAAEPVAAEPEPEPEPAKPKRRGWWSIG